MNRLQSELRRLYLPRAATSDGPDAAAPELVDARGMTRALVLEIAARAGWDAVSRTWRGCQLELELPAPAIAVSGTDGFQLWFSLAEPVAVADAHAFLESLRTHFLADVDGRHVRALPAIDPMSPDGVVHAAMVPAQQPHPQEERWSAFVAPDLAPLFAETPWLDIAPGIDGQADLLCRLASIGQDAFGAAARLLAPPAGGAEAIAGAEGASSAEPAARAAAHARTSRAGNACTEPAASEAQAFLLDVMRDETVALALRIEAAKALLPATGRAAQDAPIDPEPRRR